MNKVKQGFAGLTVPQQIERSRLITGSIITNPLYPAPNPAIAVVVAATDALEVAYNESRGRDKNKTAIMRLRRKELLFLIGQLAAYVQQASDGDEENILSSGFDVRGANTPHPVTPGPVVSVRLSDGPASGKIHVDWDKAADAVMYVVLTSLAADFSNQEPKGITTKTFKDIGSFDTGTKVWVRVIALGREEIGSPSEPMSIIVR